MTELSKFILIGGTPSSGSTLLSVILDSHPDICCGPETNVLAHPFIWGHSVGWDLLNEMPKTLSDPLDGSTWARPSPYGIDYWQQSENGLSKLISSVSRNNDIVQSLTMPLLQKTNKNIACEKSPPNAYSIAAALQSRSDIKAIFTVRNFNHVARSLEKRGNTFEVAIVRWLSKVTMAINAQRRFGKQRVLIVRYEDLVKEPENEINKLLDFIGLPKNRLDVQSMLQCKSERIQNDKTLAGEKGASSSWEFLPSDGIGRKD